MHFPLHPDTPAEGTPLEELFRGRNVDLRSAHARLRALMDAEGLPYGPRTHTYNSRLAQEVAKWAETKPGGDAIHDALFRAYFAGGRNISDAAVLVDVADRWGFPPTKRPASSMSGDTERRWMLIGRNLENMG